MFSYINKYICIDMYITTNAPPAGFKLKTNGGGERLNFQAYVSYVMQGPRRQARSGEVLIRKVIIRYHTYPA